MQSLLQVWVTLQNIEGKKVNMKNSNKLKRILLKLNELRFLYNSRDVLFNTVATCDFLNLN